MTLEVVHRHEKLAPISGVGFWSVCQRPKDAGLDLDFAVTGFDTSLVMMMMMMMMMMKMMVTECWC